MRKLFFCLCLLASVAIEAQTLRQLFLAMPDSLSLMLTKNDKADFADFLDSKMRARVRNKFGAMSEMKELTDNYLLLELSAASTLQLKKLSVNDSVQVILAVETFAGPAENSHISMYDTSWNALPVADYFESFPVPADFLLPVSPEDRMRQEEALRFADMFLMKVVLSLDNNDLQFVYTTPDYMDKESAEALRPFLETGPLVYEWRDGRMVRR